MCTPVTPTELCPGTIKKVYTAGRPPWYDTTGSLKRPLVIGVTGGTASGKTSVCNSIISQLNIRWVALLSMDSFYKGLTEEESNNAADYNFDHPNAFDYKLLVQTIKDLKAGQKVEIPHYDFVTHSRGTRTSTIYGADVIILEGILAFYWKSLRDEFDMKIFVDTDSDIRLARRLKRDIAERGRDVTGVLAQYQKFVKPSFDDYILPTMKYADIIIPRGADNHVAINLIAVHIRNRLLREGYLFNPLTNLPRWKTVPPNIHIMPKTHQIRAMNTIIRNRDTSRSDFVFYSDRLNRLLIEHALALLPYTPKTVTTPTGDQYQGVELAANVYGVSIMRSGQCMETALRAVCKSAVIGKILIQSNEKKEPRLFYLNLAKCINNPDTVVFLMDPMLGTGQSAMMAIRVLLDHRVPEENIIFLTLIAAPEGLHALSYFFPKVRVVVCEIDEALNEHMYIVPGVGNFGDRYFGTE